MNQMKRIERHEGWGTLISQLHCNIDILHPELVEVLEPAIGKYKELIVAEQELFETIRMLDTDFLGHRGISHLTLSKVVLKEGVDLGDNKQWCNYRRVMPDGYANANQLTLNAYAYYLLMSTCFEPELFAPLVAEFVNSAGDPTGNDVGQYNKIFDIHEINQALLNGLEAWKDAVYLYYYRQMCDISYKLAEQPDTTSVYFSKDHKIRYKKHTNAIYLLTGQKLESKEQLFETRSAAEAFVNQLDKIKRKGKDLEGKYSGD